MSSVQKTTRRSRISNLISHFEVLSNPNNNEEKESIRKIPKQLYAKKRRTTTQLEKEKKFVPKINRSVSLDAKNAEIDFPKKNLGVLPLLLSKSVQTVNSIENFENKIYFKESTISTQTSDSIDNFEDVLDLKKPTAQIGREQIYEPVDVIKLENARKEAQDSLEQFQNAFSDDGDYNLINCEYNNDYQFIDEDENCYDVSSKGENNENSEIIEECCSNQDDSSDCSIDEGIYENLMTIENGVSRENLYDDMKFIDDDDGYVKLRKKSIDNKDIDSEQLYKIEVVYDKSTNTTRKTIYDSNHTPRIQDISTKSSNSITDQKYYIIAELISSEETYIDSLEYIITNYMKPFTKINTGSLVGKCQYIFLNIEYIYLESKVFLQEIKQNREDYENIGRIFKRHHNLFQRYPVYIRKKHVADALVKGDFKNIIEEFARELDDRLGLSSHLLKPVQRLGKYELLLKNLLKQLHLENKQTAEVDKAVQLIQQITRKGTDLILLDLIKNNPCDLTTTGEFIMKNEFHMISPKKIEVVLFLFVKKIIIASKNSKMMDQYCYRGSIDLARLGRKSLENHLTFSLINYTKNKKHESFLFEANSMKMKTVWINAIDSLLWQQLRKQKEQQYSNMGIDEPSYIQIQQEHRLQQNIMRNFKPIPDEPRNGIIQHNQEIVIEHLPEYAPKKKQNGLKLGFIGSSIAAAGVQTATILSNFTPIIEKENILNNIASSVAQLGINDTTEAEECENKPNLLQNAVENITDTKNEKQSVSDLELETEVTVLPKSRNNSSIIPPSPTLSESSTTSDTDEKRYKNSVFYNVL